MATAGLFMSGPAFAATGTSPAVAVPEAGRDLLAEVEELVGAGGDVVGALVQEEADEADPSDVPEAVGRLGKESEILLNSEDVRDDLRGELLDFLRSDESTR
ncbi:hypothetical protein JI76_15970 [Streptomyces anulatus]|uniref:hypothetical protein n=1 Tax=Streptomyces TaxID=1883 RepID=UPI0006D9CAE0|nr:MULTISPECIES: hypothetical protein [Streptomyces]KPL33292.1 hypothetical protein JI76_15970 [Streptomyces anulatus]MCX5141880.1 hypothetical protein [Streptomyces sp. NBC_00338]